MRGPKPDRMSGGGVWFVGDSELLRRTQRPKLMAIFIAHRSPQRVFIALRVSLIVAAVLAAYSDTAPLLPQPRLVHPKVDVVHTIGQIGRKEVQQITGSGQTQKSLVGKERGALRAFSLVGRPRPVSRLAPKIATALWPSKFCF
jgi:hypothetical protein